MHMELLGHLFKDHTANFILHSNSIHILIKFHSKNSLNKNSFLIF